MSDADITLPQLLGIADAPSVESVQCIALPSLGEIDEAAEATREADEFARIEQWYALVGRRLRRAGATVLPGSGPSPWDLAISPDDARQLCAWMLKPVLETYPSTARREVLAPALWQLVGPSSRADVWPGYLVHFTRKA
jgi:hypothetical protein